MNTDVFTGAYVRTFALVSPSLPSNARMVAWPQLPAESIAAFLADCTMEPDDFEQRYGSVDGRWHELVYISLAVATLSGHVLHGKIAPSRSTMASDGSWKLSAVAYETTEGLYIREPELSLGMEVDGLQLVHTRRHLRDNIIIQPDGEIILSPGRTP